MSSIEELQNTLEEKFNRFQPAKLSGVEVSIMPVKEDIPKISIIKYYKDEDKILILLEEGDHSEKVSTEHENLFFFQDKEKNILGIEIKNFTKIKQWLNGAKEIINSEVKRKNESDSKYEIRINDLRIRKFRFFKDCLQKDLKMLL